MLALISIRLNRDSVSNGADRRTDRGLSAIRLNRANPSGGPELLGHGRSHLGYFWIRNELRAAASANPFLKGR